ncbi:MAG: NAD kinase, partial [Rhizobium sp.]|nr:NAD kinase [Rhizobium sp.]
MNHYPPVRLRERIAAAVDNDFPPFKITTTNADGSHSVALAINEVSLLRQSYQAAKLRVVIDGKVRLDELICDGLMVATPVGSTAYNLSAHGPILPLEAPLLALTPVSPFRPRRGGRARVGDKGGGGVIGVGPGQRPGNAGAAPKT